MTLQHRNELISILVVMTLIMSSMIVMFVPASPSDGSTQTQSSGSAAASSVDADFESTVVDEDDRLFTYDEEKGVYVMTQKGLEKFNLSSDPSESELIANGLITGQMEVAVQSEKDTVVGYRGYGDDGSEWGVVSYAKSFYIADAYKSNLYVGFSAGLTRVATDSVSNISYLTDWDCRLCYGTEDIGGVLPMYLIIQPTLSYQQTSVLNITDLVRENIPAGVLLNEFTKQKFKDNGIKTFNAECVLNHAEGDFDGDGNEEIAIAYCNVLVVLKLVDDENGGMKFTLINSISDYTEGWYRKSGMTLPAIVSISAGDIDNDLRDEVLIASQTETNNLDATRLSVYDIYGKDDGPAEGELVKVASDIIKLKDCGRTYYTCATSVVAGDVDSDGIQEIVLGGYVANWNDSNVHDAAYREGELFLTYIDYSFNSATGKGEMSECLCATFLCEEDGTAYNFAGCYYKDTSAREKMDHDLGAYRRLSVCYVDSTIPLQTVSLFKNTSGYFDSVFFYTGLYTLDKSSSIFFCESPLIITADKGGSSLEDRVILNIMDIEACKMTSNYQSPYEELVIAYRSYYYDYTQSKMTIRCNIYTPSDDTFTVKTGQKHDMGRISYGWYNPDNTYYEYWYIGNFDNDATIGVKIGQLYMYTDPTVFAMISAIPAEDDLANMYISQQTAIGDVSVNKKSGTTETKITETGFSVEGYEGIDGVITAIAHEGGRNGHVSGTEKRFEMEYEITSSTDAVTLYVTPVDVYVYLVTYRDEDGNVKQEIQAIPVFGTAVPYSVSYGGYILYMDNYNETMKELYKNEESATEYSVISTIELDHTPGDVSTYPTAKEKSGHEYKTTFTYLTDTTGGKGSYEENSLSGEKEEYSGCMEETYFNFDIGANIGIEAIKASFGLEIGSSKNTTKTTGTISGGGFAVSYITTEPVDLKTNAPEGNCSYYTLTALCYSEVSTYTVGVYNKTDGTYTTRTVQYTYIGFGVDRYDRPAAMGTTQTLSENDDKEFAMYPDSFCFNVYVPNNSGDKATGHETKYYEVQIYLNYVWKTVSADYLQYIGLTMRQWNGSEWTDPVYQLEPGESDYYATYMLEGFSGCDVTYLSMRVLVTYAEEAGSKETEQLHYLSEDIHLNNAMSVTLYKDGVSSGTSKTRYAPENMFEKEGYIQNGWIGSDGNFYAPGDSLAGVRVLNANWVAV